MIGKGLWFFQPPCQYMHVLIEAKVLQNNAYPYCVWRSFINHIGFYIYLFKNDDCNSPNFYVLLMGQNTIIDYSNSTSSLPLPPPFKITLILLNWSSNLNSTEPPLEHSEPKLNPWLWVRWISLTALSSDKGSGKQFYSCFCLEEVATPSLVPCLPVILSFVYLISGWEGQKEELIKKIQM